MFACVSQPVRPLSQGTRLTRLTGLVGGTETRYGLGKHLHDLPANTDFARSLELFYFGEVIYYTCVCLTKISILFLYMQLSPAYTFRCLVWGMMVFVGLTALGCTVAGLFQCDPIRKAWLTDLPGTCFNQTALFVSNAALNIAQDVIIYFLPVPMLWKLQLPLKQRVALILVFALGGFVVVTGIMRLQSLKFASVSSDPTCKRWSLTAKSGGANLAFGGHRGQLRGRHLVLHRTKRGHHVRLPGALQVADRPVRARDARHRAARGLEPYAPARRRLQR